MGYPFGPSFDFFSSLFFLPFFFFFLAFLIFFVFSSFFIIFSSFSVGSSKFFFLGLKFLNFFILFFRGHPRRVRGALSTATAPAAGKEELRLRPSPYQVQGDEFKYISVVLNKKFCPAAGYTALSRVERASDYMLAGDLTREHFVPATWLDPA